MAATSSPQPSKGKILCVDDDDAILTMLQTLFGSCGYEPVLSHGSDEALALFRQHRKDLVAVVLDLRMPRKDGWAVAREIRKESKDVPLIALSAYLTGSEKEAMLKQCEEAGFDAHATKPFAMEIFLQTIEDCVRKHKPLPFM